ncbi:unnamed protein product [Symbiodinium natans]|uniref:Uncharacterized protein n=1 Tax=Symbiodinium natans TaxID=878477 RepID=A0A812LQM4_9DINO|nr:unnamed protein product [Symbiodinium natans]CAE7249382.1 unnamed protein product [Symbiodinium natans]
MRSNSQFKFPFSKTGQWALLKKILRCYAVPRVVLTEILRLAENEPASWSASVLRKEQQLGLPVLGIETSVLSIKHIKAKLHYHAVTVVLPAVRAREQANWHSCSKAIQHWLGYSKLSWTWQNAGFASPMPKLGLSLNFKLLLGLLLHADFVPRTSWMISSISFLTVMWHCADARRSVGSNRNDAWSVTRWVRASGELLRHLDKR